MINGFIVPFVPPFANALRLVMPILSFIGFLAAELLLYCLEVQLVKMIYAKQGSGCKRMNCLWGIGAAGKTMEWL